MVLISRSRINLFLIVRFNFVFRTIVLSVILGMVDFDRTQTCINLLWGFILGYLIILSLSLATELWISIVAMRGSILDTTPRASMQYLLYVRVGKISTISQCRCQDC